MSAPATSADLDGALHATLLDRLPAGVLLLDERGAVRYANVAARLALSLDAVPLRSDAGALRPRDPSRERAWARALRAAFAGETLMVSLAHRTGRVPVALAPWRDAPPTGVLCTLPATDASETARLTAYARTYGLTPGESDVLVALARGASPRAIAQRRGSTEGTVRSQAKSILLKTGCHGLRALVADALRGPPMPLPERGT